MHIRRRSSNNGLLLGCDDDKLQFVGFLQSVLAAPTHTNTGLEQKTSPAAQICTATIMADDMRQFGGFQNDVANLPALE